MTYANVVYDSLTYKMASTTLTSFVIMCMGVFHKNLVTVLQVHVHHCLRASTKNQAMMNLNLNKKLSYHRDSARFGCRSPQHKSIM